MGFLDTLKKYLGSSADKKEKLSVVNIDKRFELMGRTGQGSMSKVWRARDRKTGRTICLKVLDKIKTAKFENRFVGLKRPSEGAICMALSHPNIVKTFEYGLTLEKEMFIVMELVEGMGLNFLIETGSPTLNGRRVEIMKQAGEGLGYLHKTGYMHRDICPRNIMVTHDGEVKLIDFGLTIPFRPEFCRPGNRTGTTVYMAPELIKRLATDQRVDMFALGVTAYEVFTGTLPWERAMTAQAHLSNMNHPCRDPREMRPDLDAQTALFLMKGVERDRELRFQNTREFVQALDELPPA